MLTKKCEGCGESFTIVKDSHGHLNKKKRFCTRSCHLRMKNVKGAEHSIKGGKAAGAVNIAKLRGTGDRTYVKENQRHQHRVIAERLIGRALLPEEVVHHEDHDKKNNHPDNLLIFPNQAEHARHHGQGHTKGRNLPCSCTTIKKLI
jgi:hypothetical protein